MVGLGIGFGFSFRGYGIFVENLEVRVFRFRVLVFIIFVLFLGKTFVVVVVSIEFFKRKLGFGIYFDWFSLDYVISFELIIGGGGECCVLIGLDVGYAFYFYF